MAAHRAGITHVVLPKRNEKVSLYMHCLAYTSPLSLLGPGGTSNQCQGAILFVTVLYRLEIIFPAPYTEPAGHISGVHR